VLGRLLRGFQNGLLDGCRDVDGHETLSREQIVLATLVDDAEVAVALVPADDPAVTEIENLS